MLNKHLTEAELHDALKHFLDSYNFMFMQLYPKEKTTIYQNKQLLAKLHHALNIEKYGQRQFMQKLFIGAPIEQISEFAKRVNKHTETFEEMQAEKFRSDLALFKWGDNDATKAFVSIFEYPAYLIPNSLQDSPFEDIVYPSEKPFKQLKDYQSTIVFKSIQHIERPNAKFLIQMPTGSGKTRVAMEIISHFLNEDKNRHVVWLADRDELCEQAMETFLEVWQHLGHHPITVRRMWGDCNIADIPSNGFTVAMYQKIRASLKNGNLNMRADLIVPDEAHTALAQTYSKVLSLLEDRRTRQTRVMGLTATPGRRPGSTIDNENLSNFFGGYAVGIETDDGVIEYLRRKRVLARCNRRQLNTNIRYTLTKQEWDELSKSFEREFPKGLLEKIANDESRNLKIILMLKEIATECHNVLVFCGSRKQAKLLCGMMIALDYSAAYVDGNSPTNYRKDMVAKFKTGEIQFIFNYGVFTTGFDVPNIDAVVITRPTTSVVLYSQMIGRGMRGPVVGGTDEFILIDVVDDIITEHGGLDDVYEYFSDYWESG